MAYRLYLYLAYKVKNRLYIQVSRRKESLAEGSSVRKLLVKHFPPVYAEDLADK